MQPGSERHVAIDWTGSEELVYLMRQFDTGGTEWLACNDCDGADCVAFDLQTPLILKPGFNWLVVSLLPGNEPVSVRLSGELGLVRPSSN